MTTKDDFTRLVDCFLQTPKAIAWVDVPPTWQPSRDGSGQETKLQVTIDGVQYGHVLSVIAVPSTGAFHLVLLYSRTCVSRLDFDDSQKHTNTLFADADGLPGVVSGKHFHRWSLNKRFIEANGSLEELKHAEELPTSIRFFEHALRWFCDETNILLPHNHSIVLPRMLI